MDELPSRPISDGRRDAIHRALLAGLLGNIATKIERHEYAGPRNVKLSIHPGSGLFKAQPQWLMAAELVETTRLYARTCGRIQPQWIERAAQHLVKRSYSDPHWNEHSHHVNAYEKVTLFGLVLVPRRSVNYGPIDPRIARQVFILHALVDGRFKTSAPFLRKNLELAQEARQLEAKVRRRDLLLEPQQLYGFYDARIPADVYDGPSFERWFRHAEEHHRHQLRMALTDLLRDDAPPVSTELFPDHLTAAGNRFQLEYYLEPSDPADGVTAIVPLVALNHLPANAFDWLVPGWLTDKIVAMIRTLPRTVRTRLVPAPDVAQRVAREIRFGEASFLATLADRLGNIAGEVIPISAFNLDEVPPHLRVNIRVVDESGKTLAASRSLPELREKLGGVTRDVFKDLPRSPFQRDDVRRWDFGDLPDSVTIRRPGITVQGYPTLVEDGQRVHLRLLDSPEAAAREMRRGMTRLFMQQLSQEFKYIARNLRGFATMAMHYSTIGPAEQLRQQLLLAAADQAMFARDPSVVRSQSEFAARAADAWKRLNPAADEIAGQAGSALAAYHAVATILERKHPDHYQPAIRDVREQLRHLFPPAFVLTTQPEWRAHLARFARAAEARLTKLPAWGAPRDTQLMNQVRPFWLQYHDRVTRKPGTAANLDAILFRWMIEELRVSLFALELKTSIPVSPQRLERQWALIRD